MPAEPPPSQLVDAVRASASRLKEKQTALDARAKELDAFKARLDQDRAALERQAAKIIEDRKGLDQERQGLDDVRASMERDLGAINEGRDKLAQDQVRLQEATRAVEEREKAIKGDEERVGRLVQEFNGQMKDSGSNLHDLLERGETFIKLQADWLAAVEAREKELRTISDELHTRQDEFTRQHESLVALKASFKAELDRMLAEHETLTNKERSILEAEKYLASALQIEGLAAEETPMPAREEPAAPVAPEPVAPEPEPAPAPQPEIVVVQAPVPVKEEAPVEEAPAPVPKPRPTKAEATERLARAVEAWKRARDSGFKVSDIRKTVKFARDAIENGEYERALQFAGEILEQLQAPAAAK